jgi:hypothetical protein
MRCVRIVLLTTVGALCIMTSICLYGSTSFSVGFLLLASFVFLEFLADGLARFRDLLLDTTFFFGTGLPRLIVL